MLARALVVGTVLPMVREMERHEEKEISVLASPMLVAWRSKMLRWTLRPTLLVYSTARPTKALTTARVMTVTMRTFPAVAGRCLFKCIVFIDSW